MLNTAIIFSEDKEMPFSKARYQTAKLKLKRKDIAKLMAYYFCDESIEEVRGNKKLLCEITDDAARAAILDVINNTDSEALLKWMEVIMCRYFERHSWSKLQTPERTVMEVKYDI
ncbi:hypothetical protein MKL42_09445 [Acinetobacter sp. AOR15_HL]|uniref:hypothetical protein n=1 Tax=unclassified Acinetobacter TaxID=196816 RepID=UPI0022EB337C|nr:MULTISPECIES: hypothetical protein [unclassified Acinetobacter]MDA3557716.1 hypothetical protein [Acinetobacter sp. AOR15_HL]MDA3570941.1 hypothetical protein [Acinetobacter sp. AOR14_HL]